MSHIVQFSSQLLLNIIFQNHNWLFEAGKTNTWIRRKKLLCTGYIVLEHRGEMCFQFVLNILEREVLCSVLCVPEHRVLEHRAEEQTAAFPETGFTPIFHRLVSSWWEWCHMQFNNHFLQRLSEMMNFTRFLVAFLVIGSLIESSTSPGGGWGEWRSGF